MLASYNKHVSLTLSCAIYDKLSYYHGTTSCHSIYYKMWFNHCNSSCDACCSFVVTGSRWVSCIGKINHCHLQCQHL